MGWRRSLSRGIDLEFSPVLGEMIRTAQCEREIAATRLPRMVTV
jgi:hypothetical protein